MFFDKIQQLRRADAAVPGRVEVIPQVEKKTAQDVAHAYHYTPFSGGLDTENRQDFFDFIAVTVNEDLTGNTCQI